MSKKRSRGSVFDAVDQLNSQDDRASRKRKSATAKQLRKSRAAKSQTRLHGHLMECRILLQRVLGSVGGEEGGEEDTSASVGENSSSAEQACNQLLAKLLTARSHLVGSSSSSDGDPDTPDYSEIVQSHDQLSQLLQSEYEDLREGWKQVLDQKHKDLRLHAGLTAKAQFRVMDSTFWQQVESTVSHEDLRQSAQNASEQIEFDDSKVYQHMLQDFLQASSMHGGAEEAAAQRLRRAMKNSKSSSKKNLVDRRASKGRKMRYDTIPKLVNYTFPVSRPVVGMMDEDAWFKSLFGGVANKTR